MTYDAKEISEQEGYPLELYEFTDGVETLNFTSGDEEITDVTPPRVWTPEPIRRGQPSQSSNLDAATLAITAPRDFPIALRYRIYVPSASWFLTIFRFHRNDGVTPERRVLFKGLIRSVSWSDAFATLHVQSIVGLLKSEGLRLQYQRGCNHMHYGPGCLVNPDLHEFAGQIIEISGQTVKVSVPETPYNPPFSGLVAGQALLGTAVAENGERRMIRLALFTGPSGPHVLTLLQPFSEAAVGQTLVVRRGCARNQAACSFFGNLARYGGIPTIPQNNPFVHGIEA